MHSAKKSYIPEFDGLRALAAIAVILGHASALDSPIRWTGCAFLAVRFFFVLSGFLITSVLLESKEILATNRSGLFRQLKQFYIRRALRIFPPYYAFLIFFVCVGNAFVLETLGWHASYLTNFFFANTGRTDPPISHFWTLAVEEQFYLLWPLIVLIFSRRKLLFVTGSLILAGFAYRFLGTEFGLTRPQILYSPLASLDSLCLGSLAAILAREPGIFSPSLNWLRKVGFYFALPALVVTLVFLARGNNSPFEIYGQFFMAIFSAALLLNYRFSETAFGSRLLRTPSLRYLGKISYGIYLYHFPFDRMLYAGWVKAGIAPDSVFARFPFVLGCSVTVAAISWKLLEKPLTGLKRFFPYEPAMIPASQQKSVAVPQSTQQKGVGEI